MILFVHARHLTRLFFTADFYLILFMMLRRLKNLFKRKKKEEKVVETEETDKRTEKVRYHVLPIAVIDRDGNEADKSIVSNAKVVCKLPYEADPIRFGVRLYGGNMFLAKMMLQAHLVKLLRCRMHSKRRGPRKPRASPAERAEWWKAMGA